MKKVSPEKNHSRVGRSVRALLGVLAGTALFGCSADGSIADGSGQEFASTSQAITAETPRISALLAGAGGTGGFILREVGGAMLENANQTFAYDPASSIKVLVALSVLQQVDAGTFNLNTPVTHFSGLNNTCPTGAGAQSTLTLTQLMRQMLDLSDNAATRTLIDLLGGFNTINATAQNLGMNSTSMVVYPGCNITNRMTQLDAALLYEGVANGSLLSQASRTALYAAMPASTSDFSLTLAAANTIVDQEATAQGISTAEATQFKSLLQLHYKAGNDQWCSPGCLSYYAISGLAEIPTCSAGAQTTTSYAWGLFINGGPNETTTRTTFFANQAEPLRSVLRQGLVAWANCTPSNSDLYLEAECPSSSVGAYGSTQTNQSGYSGNGHITGNDNTTASSYNGTSDDRATYTASVSPGSYDIYFRVETNGSGSDDSWYYRVNSGTWVTENNHAGSRGWKWVKGANSASVGGNVTIEVANREDGLDIDKIALIPAGDPAPTGLGGMANNCGGSCTPETCGSVGASCGNPSDGCGGTLSCGGCSGSETCNTSFQCESTGGGNEPCTPSLTFANGETNSGNFGTQGAFCFRTSFNISGWGCSNFNGRTMSVNNGTPSSNCGFGLPAKHDGYYYFESTSGSYPWASVYWW